MMICTKIHLTIYTLAKTLFVSVVVAPIAVATTPSVSEATPKVLALRWQPSQDYRQPELSMVIVILAWLANVV